MKVFRNTFPNELRNKFKNNDGKFPESVKEYDVIDYLIKSQHAKSKKTKHIFLMSILVNKVHFIQ